MAQTIEYLGNKTHTLYLWSTERYMDQTIRTKDDKTFPVLGKLGETKEFKAEVRIAQTDSTGVAEKPILLKQWTIPSNIKDKYLHALLAKKGYPKNRDDKDREWILFPGCKAAAEAIEVIDRLLNEVLTGKSAITNYPLFDYQKVISDWAVDRYSKGSKHVLINAIMRAGKCMISHSIVKQLGFQKVLIVTGKPGAIPSWSVLAKGGEEEHVDYNNFIFHHYDDLKKSTIQFGQGDCDIVALSLQFAGRHLNSQSSSLLNQVLSIDWDCIIFDEQHYATTTEKTQDFLNSLKTKFLIELSGTPYKTLLSNRIPEEDTASFDYIEEQKIRQDLLSANADDEQTRQFKYKAQIDWALINVPQNIKTMVNEENFNLGARGLFSTDKDNLVYRDAINELLNHIKLRGYKNLPGDYDNFVEKVTKHTLWVLPKNVKAIKLVAQMLQEHPYFKKYDIIVATGSNDESQATVKDIDDVKQRILNVQVGKVDHIGTITLTCGRFLEGTSVPEWWAVHQINDAKSAEDYFQGSFRCKTPWVKGDKTKVIVFDYNPERFVSLMYQHIERTADATERKAEDIATEFTDCSDVFDYTDNDWKIVPGTDLQTRFLADIKNYTDRVGSLIDEQAITSEIRKMFAGKNQDANTVTASSFFNSNDLERGSNQKRLNKYHDNGSRHDEKEEDVVAQIRYALKQIYELINIAWAEGWTISCLDDVVTSQDTKLVESVTGLKPKEWKKITKVIDVIGMNRAIGQYNAFQ